MGRFTTRPKTPPSGVPMPELTSRAFAAAKLAMRGQSYGTDDRMDCASHIVLKVLESEREDHGVTPQSHVTETAAAFGRLYGMAANYRRGLDRERVREAEDAARHAAADVVSGYRDLTQEATVTPDPAAAHPVARDMLSALGMPRLGKLYPVAYAAVRASAGMTAAETAAELGVTPAKLRKDVERFSGRLPSAATHGEAEHAAALHIPLGGVTGGHAAGMRDVPDMLRTVNALHPPKDAPVKTRTRKPNPRKTPAAWTRDLPPRTRMRLETAAKIRQGRMTR